MANVRAAVYLTITLLKWCYGEIANTVPESWYSANVIKDGTFSPKSLSEIFSTEDTFSTINPIIVLPTSRSPPPTSLQTSLDPFTGSTLPSSIFSRDPTTLQTFPTTSPLSSLQTFPSTPSSISPIQTFPPSSPLFSSSISTFTPITSTLAPPTIVTSPPTPQVQNIPNQAFPNPPNPPNIQYILCATCQQPTQSSPAPVPSPTPSSTPTPLPITASPALLSTFPRTNPTTIPSQVPCATNPPFITNATIRGYPFIRIRMFSSKGLPPVVRSTTIRTTTTRRPRRNRKNNYDACVNACGGGRNPICAAPLATRPVDPNALRGFPSICHMACYNSFKKIQYEKLVDGRCGRLRTRIRPVDSRDKIKKDDLNKAQYQVISGSDPLTVIEVGSKK